MVKNIVNRVNSLFVDNIYSISNLWSAYSKM